MHFLAGDAELIKRATGVAVLQVCLSLHCGLQALDQHVTSY